MRRALPAALLVAVTAALPVRGGTAVPARSTPPVITVHAKEFAFTGPARLAAGPTTFRLVNDGREPHQISIVQLTQGKTLAEYVDAIKANRPTPWAIGAGGPNTAGPGQTAEATVTLDPGNYALVCWIPSPGRGLVPHMVQGMIQPLTITPVTAGLAPAAPANALPSSAPDVRLDLFDYGFKFSQPLTAGRHVIQVVNTGALEHEAVVVKLAPGKTMRDVDAWFTGGMQGPSPITLTPGMSGLGTGRTGTFVTTLTPGRYGLVCWIPDVKDGKPHAMHGMVQEFTVAAR